jgi:hypothetical protein
MGSRHPPPRAIVPDDEVRCDACGDVITSADDDDGHAIAGAGVYVWTRGDEVRFEKAPLCAACASAIGVSALARWELEEEEG